MTPLNEIIRVRLDSTYQDLPAAVIDEATSPVSLGEQTAAAGGRVRVKVHYSTRVEELRRNIRGRTMTLTRTRPSTLYNIESAETSDDRRWLYLVGKRAGDSKS